MMGLLRIVAVAALTTPALAATASGEVAKPHGSHSGFVIEDEHGGNH